MTDYPAPVVPFQPSRKRPAQVLAVTGGKGGVGKTTVSINLALAFAGLGRNAYLLDADMGLANVDVMLGLKPRRTLAHVLNGECSLRDIVLHGPAGLRVIPGASGLRRMAELSAAQRLGLVNAFGELGDSTDVLVIDTPAGIAGGVVDLCSASREVIVVVCNEPASITDAYAVIKLLNQECGRSRVRVLVNMVQGQAEGRSVFQRLVEVADNFLDVSLDLVGVIPFDGAVRSSVQRQRALLQSAPGSIAAGEFKKLADRADKWPVPRQANGGVEFFVEQLVAEPAAEVAQL